MTEPWDSVDKETNDYIEMAQMAREAGDSEIADEIENHVDAINKRIEELEFQSMLSDEADSSDSFVHIHSGAGGTESCDWAAMLMRMYTRWAERRGFKVEMMDMQPGDEAGISRAILAIRGEFSYGFLKAENGVHRLVRISPFDSNKRRHTSFASVHVYPDIDDTIVVDINENDLRIKLAAARAVLAKLDDRRCARRREPRGGRVRVPHLDRGRASAGGRRGGGRGERSPACPVAG